MGVAVAVMTGLGFTVKVTVELPVQPEAVPVTVYVVVFAGETVVCVPIKEPGIQTKEVPTTLLFATKIDDAPLQIAAGVAVEVTTGSGFTVTETVALPEQPEAEPVTVYIVVVAGETETGVPLKLPGIHV